MHVCLCMCNVSVFRDTGWLAVVERERERWSMHVCLCMCNVSVLGTLVGWQWFKAGSGLRQPPTS